MPPLKFSNIVSSLKELVASVCSPEQLTGVGLYYLGSSKLYPRLSRRQFCSEEVEEIFFYAKITGFKDIFSKKGPLPSVPKDTVAFDSSDLQLPDGRV